MNLYAHQKKIIKDDPKKCLIAWGTGSGKTATALMLAKGTTLVIAPKTTRDDKTWQNNLKKINKDITLTVISKEDMRKNYMSLAAFDTLIIDEAHTVSGLTPNVTYRNKKPYPKTSQLFEACHSYIKMNKPKRLYLLTATPIRSPMSVLALAWLLGKEIDFYKFRDFFYQKLPMPGRDVFSAKKSNLVKQKLGEIVSKLGYVGKLSDFADVPEQTHKIIPIYLTIEQQKALRIVETDYPDLLVAIGKKHQIEQGVLSGDKYNEAKVYAENKTEAIIDLYEEFGKILVFAKYTAHIELIRAKLPDNIKIFILTGATKDRENVIKEANNADSCIVIAQSTISAGYELPSFRCTVYSSMSYSYVDLAQSWGRTLRINNLQKNLYVYLLAGEMDHAIYKALENKQDFSEKMYAEARK